MWNRSCLGGISLIPRTTSPFKETSVARTSESDLLSPPKGIFFPGEEAFSPAAPANSDVCLLNHCVTCEPHVSSRERGVG